MRHKIKALGLAFIAVAVMSMAAATGAQASELHVTTPNAAVIFGHQVQTHKHKFVVTAGPTECTQATLEATVQNTGVSQQQVTEQEVTATGTYSGCTAFGQAAQIVMNGCKYTVTNKHSVTGHTTPNTNYVDITGCTSGKQIEVKTGICTITVPEQHNLSHAVNTNTTTPNPHDIDQTVTITGIKYENHGVLCPNYGGANTVTRTDGQFVGETTVQARQHVGGQQVTLHGHQYQALSQAGVLVGIQST